MAHLKLKIEIKLASEDNSDESVYFKVDGGRFESDKTLKLTQDCRYRLKLTLKPAEKLSAVQVLGQKVDHNDVSGSDDTSSYECYCNTNGMEATKKNQRMNLPIVLEVKGEIQVNLQCKLYSQNDRKHSTWGTALHHVDVTCSRTEGQMAYHIKELAFK